MPGREELADSVAAFERDKPCDDEGVTAMLVECAAPEISWDGVRHAEYRTLACEQEDVVGPYGGDSMVVFRTLDVPEAGEYEVTVIAEDLTGGALGYGLYMTACGSCRGRETEGVGTGRSVRMKLEAGVHSLRLFGPAREEASVGWSIERMP